MSFTHLHSHSEYSIADGLFAPKKWAEAIESSGFKAHALTDHGNVAGHAPFYQAMKDRNLTPILGCEFYYVDDPTDKTPENRFASHLVLIAKNYDGYRNLLKLQQLSFTEGFYYRPRIGWEWLQKYSSGLVCLTACLGGILSREVWKEINAEKEGKFTRKNALERRYSQLQWLFGGDLYVEFQGHNSDDQRAIQKVFYDRLVGLDGFKQIVTNDCHYILSKHAPMQEMIMHHAASKKSENAGQSFTKFDSLWLKTPIDLVKTFLEHHKYLPKEFVFDGMKATEEVFEKCVNFEFPTGKHYLPKFRKGKNSKEIFIQLTTKKLDNFLTERGWKGHWRQDEYIQRFKKEFTVITEYKLEDYFLIVWDIVRFANSQGIYVGLGRGSAAGCLISYLLGIVRIDPIEYGLIFERFLNKNRCENGELPDIDLDFESRRRSEIKEYIYRTYGSEHVAEIGTYGRMQLRTGILDFGVAMEVADRKELLNITTKLELDKEDSKDLDAAMGLDPRLNNIVDRNPDFGYFVREIIGQVKSMGVHPAGVIVANEPIAEITGIKTQSSKETGDRIITTQSEDKYLLAQGLVKLDILGIKEYDQIKFIIENAPGCGLTVENYVEEIMKLEFFYQTDPLDSTFERQAVIWDKFKNLETDGVFQFASDTMKNLLSMMEPDCVDDLIAANALVRPGCLENGWHIQYCDRKHGREAISYVHPDLEKVLGPTYGVIVFQEQFMEVFRVLGGIPLVKADTIRSALGKKDKKKLEGFKKEFIDGSAKKIGVNEAEELWDQIEKAAGYTFNRSHSAAYSVLAYISQYLKVKYPNYFWCAQLEWDAVKNNQEDLSLHHKIANDGGVKSVYVDINRSKSNFRVDQDTNELIWSLNSVKGLGKKTAEEIEAHQPFVDFDDFYNRVNKTKVRWNHILNLCYAGAFEKLGDRRDIINFLYAQKNAKDKVKPDLTDEHMLFSFYNIMGFFQQPLKSVLTGFHSGSMMDKNSDLDGLPEDWPVKIGGMITAIRKIKTKNGDTMGFLELTDMEGNASITVFPEKWSKYVTEIEDGNIMMIEGFKNSHNGKSSVVVNTLEKIG